MLYDVAIVGAGPAGCSAAISLSQSNFKVLLVEASTFPRYRPGESLHPGIEPIFESLGVNQEIKAADFIRYPGHRVSRTGNLPDKLEKFSNQKGDNWQGYQAWRPKLDQILLEKAQNQGVTVWQPCQVRSPKFDGTHLRGLETDQGEVQAEYILDASGRSQWLSRHLELPTLKYSPPLLVRYGYVDYPKDFTNFDIPVFHRDQLGWNWVARVHQDKCAWVSMRWDGVDPGKDWQPPQLKTQIPIGPSKREDMTWRIRENIADEGWFLLGDAGVVLDPASSHGVLRALMSGMQAAHLISKTFKGIISRNRAAQIYSQWLKEWFYRDVIRLRELYAEISL